MARLLQLILVTFIILYDTSKLLTLEVRFLNDPVNSSLFKEPESDSDHKQEHEQEPAAKQQGSQRKRLTMRALQRVKRKDPELVSTDMFTSSFSNYPFDCDRQDVLVESCCYCNLKVLLSTLIFFLFGAEADLSYFFGDFNLKTCGNVLRMLLKRLALSPGMSLLLKMYLRSCNKGFFLLKFIDSIQIEETFM